MEISGKFLKSVLELSTIEEVSAFEEVSVIEDTTAPSTSTPLKIKEKDDVQGVATPEAAKGKRKAKKAMPGHHQCHECGNVYKFRSSLLHHEKCQHGARGGKTFQCVECQLKFIRKRDLERHENVVHTKVKPHTCQTCLKTFADKKNLTKSRHACQPNEPFPCSHCGKTFPLRKYLADHMRYTHCDASSRSCACKHCFTSFKHREQLRRHSVKCVSNAEKDLCA